ncbi:hypothetical protein DL96DRAFT_1706285 [Flagelloscypha sp. PMI_526]|nr:hypothetical protein DL96DRAFT_1706285 [Flagelloscypha sp. PMI_526]
MFNKLSRGVLNSDLKQPRCFCSRRWADTRAAAVRPNQPYFSRYRDNYLDCRSQRPSDFSLQLTNEIFHDTFAIANNVPTASGKITLDLPELKPGDGYALIATQDANVNAVLGQSGGFSVGAATITSSSTTSGTATSASSLASVQSISTSAFGSTVKASTTAPATSAAAATTSTTPNSAHETSFSILGMVAAVFLATGL